MAERISAIDPAVDELRRKARRRLVGAVVLALAAAVLVPMLLEKEPPSLGEDVSVRIPPVDEGKFVNRLSPPVAAGKNESTPGSAAPPKNAPMAAPSAASPSPAPVPNKSEPSKTSDASPTAAPSTDVTPTAAKSPPDTAPQPTTAPAPTSAEPKSPAVVEPAPEAKSAPKPAAAAQTATKGKPAEGSYVVQLAAFSDDKGANALASKLKRNGYPAYTEATQTSHGTLYRVRVGGYPSREAAGDARNKLKGDGYAGIVAPAH